MFIICWFTGQATRKWSVVGKKLPGKNKIEKNVKSGVPVIQKGLVL
jgi:hypothetical protein